jgi:hypothetical protein
LKALREAQATLRAHVEPSGSEGRDDGPAPEETVNRLFDILDNHRLFEAQRAIDPLLGNQPLKH